MRTDHAFSIGGSTESTIDAGGIDGRDRGNVKGSGAWMAVGGFCFASVRSERWKGNSFLDLGFYIFPKYQRQLNHDNHPARNASPAGRFYRLRDPAFRRNAAQLRGRRFERLA